MKKSISPLQKTLLFLFLLLSVFAGFYFMNSINYSKHNEIRAVYINHPEYLPTKTSAIRTSFGFKNVIADKYWMQAIQYIGSNAVSSDYKKYLFIILDLVTELNPYFEHPYIIGQLLIPNYNERYETLEDSEQNKYIDQAIELGLKGVKNFCNLEKIDLIDKENDLQKIWNDPLYKNPCKTYTIPYYLAYVYFFYKHEPINASKYYKVASANEDSLEGAKVLSAIMQGKGGNREKSYFMFLNIAKSINGSIGSCSIYASELENLGANIFLTKNTPLSGDILKAVETTRNKNFGKFSGEDDDKILSDTECLSYVNKAIRELNLSYIETANKKFELDHNGLPARHAKGLFEEGYIDFLPTDFQQYETYGIIYEYNYDTKHYDYAMGTYE